MTVQEIKALKAELEVALLQALTDFHARTGLLVDSVGVERRVLQRVGLPDQPYVSSVNITLESL